MFVKNESPSTVKGERLIGVLSLSIYAQCEYDLEVTLAFCTIMLLVYDII